MQCNNILAIKVDNRNNDSTSVQQVLTNHGCEIRARLGVPQQDVNSCTNIGLLILQVCDSTDQMDKLIGELNGIESVTAKYMTM